MEEKNELNEILLKTEQKQGNTKNILLVTAGCLIFFFLLIIGSKMFSDTDSAEQGVVKGVPPKVSKAPEIDSFKPVKVNENKSMKTPLDEIEEELKRERALALKEKEQKINPTPPPPPSLPIVEQKVQQEPKKVVEESVKKIEPKQEEIVIPKPKIVEQVVKKEEPKKVVEPKEEPQEKVKKYYIQVGSFENNPSNELVKAITSNGFNYLVKEKPMSKKIYKRVYIGPFKTKQEAVANLAKARKSVGSDDAFIIWDY